MTRVEKKNIDYFTLFSMKRHILRVHITLMSTHKVCFYGEIKNIYLLNSLLPRDTETIYSHNFRTLCLDFFKNHWKNLQ